MAWREEEESHRLSTLIASPCPCAGGGATPARRSIPSSSTLHVSCDVLQLHLQESVHDDAVGLDHHPLDFAREPLHHEPAVIVEIGVGDHDVIDVVEGERPRLSGDVEAEADGGRREVHEVGAAANSETGK
jgi:hypothetical protein